MAADKKIKIKVMWIYIAHSRETSKALKHGSHSFTCNYTNACLYLVSVHQMAPPRLRLQPILIYLPRKDERLSRPGWLTYSEWFTHISGHPSAAGRAQDRESSLVKDQLYHATNQVMVSAKHSKWCAADAKGSV